MADENTGILDSKQLSQIDESLNLIKSILKPHLTTLSVSERRTKLKIKDKTLNFVKKALGYTKTHSQFSPQFLDTVQFEKDVVNFEAMEKIENSIKELLTSVIDSRINSGSSAYKSGLSYYDSTGQAVKMKVNGAKTVYDDLRSKFEKNGPKKLKTSKEA
jgi:hypothetical protein